MKQKLIELEGETDKYTIKVRYFRISFSTIDRTNRQEIIKVIEELNNMINQEDDKKTFIEHRTQQWQHSHSFQTSTNHIPS